MFDIGFQEIVVILLVALIVVGPKNIPQVARALGRALAEFRRAMNEVKDAVESSEIAREFKEEYEKTRDVMRKMPEEYFSQTKDSDKEADNSRNVGKNP